MADLPMVKAGDPHVATHNEERTRINELSDLVNDFIDTPTSQRMPLYAPNKDYKGPAATDSPTFSAGIAVDAAFNKVYTVGASSLPADWPVDAFGDTAVTSTVWFAKDSRGQGTVTTYRFMCDGPEFGWQTHLSLPTTADVYIDGKPFSGNPITPAVTTGLSPIGLQKMVFGSAKPRLIELRTAGGLMGIFTKNPYRIWKPPPADNPSILVVGASYVQPFNMNDATAGQTSGEKYLTGPYQRMAALLGLTKMVTDGIGGSGYLAPSVYNMPFNHVDRIAHRNRIKPNVLIVHDGGANDLYNGYSISAITAAMVAYWTQARIDLPEAKLVFVEGLAPPVFTPSTFNANYKTLRQNVQAAMASAGIGMYFLDVATTNPPLNGTGYVTATTGNGNSDIYVGSDGTHLTAGKGAPYIRSVLAPKIEKVLFDTGPLIGQLIL